MFVYNRIRSRLHLVITDVFYKKKTADRDDSDPEETEDQEQQDDDDKEEEVDNNDASIPSLENPSLLHASLPRLLMSLRCRRKPLSSELQKHSIDDYTRRR